jgi:hypothetical protein
MAAFDVQTRTLISRTQLGRRPPNGRTGSVLVLAILLFAVVFLFPLYWMAPAAQVGLRRSSRVPPTLIPHPQLQQLLHRLERGFDLGPAAVEHRATTRPARWLPAGLRRRPRPTRSPSCGPVLGNVVLFGMLATLMIPATVLVMPTYLTATTCRSCTGACSTRRGDLAALGGQRVQHLPAQAVLRLDPGGTAGRRGRSTARGRCARCGRSCCRCRGRSSAWCPSSPRWQRVEGLPLAAAGAHRSSAQTVNTGLLKLTPSACRRTS